MTFTVLDEMCFNKPHAAHT